MAFSFVPSATVSLTRLELYLNDVEISMVTSALFTGASFLLSNYKFLDVSE